MAQHKSSRRKVVISSWKHTNGANQFLDVLEELTANVAAARVKIAADTNTTWDTDYVASVGVSAIDMDAKSIGQHKSSLRKMTIDKMAHKRLANEVIDTLEEGQVTLNLVLAQMDADAGTLSIDSVYEAFKVADPIDADASGDGPSRSSLRRVMRSAVKHREFGNSLSDEIEAVSADINAMIDEIKAKN
jgi:hypothetical protein